MTIRPSIADGSYQRASADTPFYVSMEAMGVRGFALAPTIPARIERLVRRTLLRQSNPDCTLVKRVRHRGRANRLASMTIETPTRRHEMHYRPGTSDEDVIWQIFSRRDYDLAMLKRFGEIHAFVEHQHHCGLRPLIVDAGANIGISAAFFALTFPTALIVAIEPEGSNFDLLVKNTHGLNVRCLHAALSAQTGNAVVVDTGDGNWAFRTKKSQDGAANPGVSCVTIDALYAEYGAAGAHYPFLAKIDIEGGEQDVFTCNTGWVARTPLVLAELHDWLFPKQRTALPFLRCVSKLDRDFVYNGEDVFSIANDFSITNDFSIIDDLSAAS